MKGDMSQKIVALVPMRHNSERVPRKNYRQFNGKPLYHYIISTLLDCPLISEILIDTDSPAILEDASRTFPSVHLIKRPENIRGGDVPMNTILLHDVKQIDADWYIQTHSTNPLLTSSTINTAIETFFEALPLYDSLFTVTRLQTRLWAENGRPVNHDPSVLLRTQDLPPTFEENSNMYIFNRKNLENRENRIGETPLMFEVDRIEAIDIDEEIDFTIAELIHKQLNREKPS